MSDPAFKSLVLSHIKQIRMSMRVDAAMIVFKKFLEGQRAKAWFFRMLDKRFTVKEVHELTPKTPNSCIV